MKPEDIPENIKSKIKDIHKTEMGEFLKNYKVAMVTPGEAVGTVAAQSIGEPGTQMSLAAEERVIVSDNNAIKPVSIGIFVDSLMEKFGSKNIDMTEVCDLPSEMDILVPSLNQDGKVKWKRLISCSRHRCERELLEISTRSGRRIVATDNHSFVIRHNNKIIPILGSRLGVGDRIPVLRDLPWASQLLVLEMSEFLPKNEFWYGSELKKAMISGSKLAKNQGITYTIPVGVDQLRNYVNGLNSFEVEDGFVYPFQNHGRVSIPEKIELDSLFGWFIGSYLGEGSITRYSVTISNTDEEFLAKVRIAAQRFNASYSEKDNFRGFARGHDLRIHSRVLSELLTRSCGKGSANKRVPLFAYSANEDFVSGLLRAYFDGDGNVTVLRKAIRASSRSRELIDGICLLLSRVGIFATKHSGNNEYSLSISHRYAKLFKERIGFETSEKREALEQLCSLPEKKHSYDIVEMVPNFGSIFWDLAKKTGLPSRLVNNFTKRQRIGRKTLQKYLLLFKKLASKKGIDISKELLLLKQILDEDIVWDEIVSIRRIQPMNTYVYDFSVDGLETFTTFDGVITHNTLRTFHYAGVAELSVPLGLPRLIEIIDAKRSPRNPIMTIFLEEKHSKDKEFVHKLADKLQERFLLDVCDMRIDVKNRDLVIKTNNEDAKKILQKSIDEEIKGNKFVIKKKSLSDLKKLKDKLDKKRVGGIKDISRVFVRELNGEYVIYTEGSNLKSVLNIKGIDGKRITTSDILQIYETRGIEAARNAIIREAMEVLEDQNLEVDIRHIMLVADQMTVSGEVQAVGRQGISGTKESVLARAAFEETEKHILNAALYGEVDTLDGVAENIIVGQPIPIGTGTVELAVKKMSKIRKDERLQERD